MDKETTKMIPGDELHLTMLMAPYSLNLVTGQDRQHLLAFGRAAFDAGKNTGQATPFLNQIAEPVTAGAAVRAFRDYLGVHDGIKLGGQAMDDMALDLARIALDFKHLVESQHPDDAAVDALAALMKAKLAEKRAKGYGGWNDKTQCPQQRLSDMLRAHVDKGDPVDVANFCAMLSARGEGIAAAPQAVQAAVPEGWKLVPAKPTEAMVGAIMSEGEVDAVAGLAPELRPILLERAGIAARYTAMLAAAPAHPAEGVPAQAAAPAPDQRAAFEAWLGIKPCGAAHDFGWAAWQARAALTTAQPAAQEVQPFGWLITKSKLPGDVEFTQDPARENLARSFGYQTQSLYSQPAAQGMEALPMQASEGVEDVAVMEHPEWMLVHKETGAQKPLDSQWTVRAALQAAQGAATTGYIAPKGRYVPPVLFSPYTGEPRDARDIASDPRGILIVPPGAALAAQAKQGGAANG